MPQEIKKLVIGTRRSPLALWQSRFVKSQLEQAYPTLVVELAEIDTKGDLTQERNEPLPEIGGKGLFTLELENALAAGTIDLAVHSLKDLPVEESSEFDFCAILRRGPVEDILFARGQVPFWELPAGSRIGTSSLRRSAQLKHLRRDIETVSIRGNVDTRIAKVLERNEGYDAAVLAQAGVERLGRIGQSSHIFSVEEILPAPGQGALAVQGLRERADLKALCARLHHPQTASAVAAERAFLNRLEAGCSTPVAALAQIKGGRLKLIGRCIEENGERVVEVSAVGETAQPEKLGLAIAEQALAKGAAELLAASVKNGR